MGTATRRSTVSHTGWRLTQGSLQWTVLALLVACFAASFTHAAEPGTDPVKRLLLISTGSRLAPGFIMVDQQILAALNRTPAPKVEIYAENLDTVRFPAERSQRIFA